jgi:peptide/nickel transport system ATP-binding protein
MAGSGTAHMRTEDVLLRAEHLVVEFGSGRNRVRAVSDVSFDVARGETLGLVGESGCGKSTTGRAVALVHNPDSGSVKFEGTELTDLSRADLRRARTKIQMVFQDPISSLNPRRRVLDAVVEPLSVWGIGTRDERTAKARATLESVGIDPDDAGGRRPIEMSGGQCQRVSIARALMLEPIVLVCDEPVSALDVSVQAQILNLLDDLKRDRGLTMVFIAHDLAVVKNVSDRVAVMYLGKLCEVAPPDVLYRTPEHPYTEALLTSIPEPDPGVARNGKAPLSGDLPSPIDPPSGCRFRTRCPFAQQVCAEQEPEMRAVGPDHFVACHFPLGSNPVAAPSPLARPAPPPSAPSAPPPPTPTFLAPAAEPAPVPWSVQAPDQPPVQAPSPTAAPPSAPPPPPTPRPTPTPGPTQAPPVPPKQSEERSPLWIDPQG